ncbi:putative esterase [Geosmithia morbida]|uniref:Esterase n=1 Tax=Geosmithia morbida TaxID=1094350 RepID=A0A9P5CXR7_9HYPO|nr:putative esterase [Geosmithia morbida]KAF4119583.1 putative esterase [Geosmithia morbida]
MASDNSLKLPRILCLHGGGTNADVFQLQSRSIIRRLGSTFRFVFINAPFYSDTHPDIVPFFGDLAPFYRWLRWEGGHEHDEEAESKILETCRRAMDKDPGSGAWVGVMGFSQGAKIAASLLWAQEHVDGGDGPFKFGIIIAGRAPIVVLDPQKKLHPVPYTANANQMSVESKDLAPDNKGQHAISIPTLHVHGLQDPGMHLHRVMADKYCKDGTARSIEWDGGHRLPIRPDDVEIMVSEILDMVKDASVLPRE